MPQAPGRLVSALTVAATPAEAVAAIPFPHASSNAPASNATFSGVPRSAALTFLSFESDSVTVLPSPPRTTSPASDSCDPDGPISRTDPGTVSDASMRSLNERDTVWRARSTTGTEPAASAGAVVSGVTSIVLSCTAANRFPTTSAVIP